MEIQIIKVLLYIIAVVQRYTASYWRIITFGDLVDTYY